MKKIEQFDNEEEKNYIGFTKLTFLSSVGSSMERLLLVEVGEGHRGAISLGLPQQWCSRHSHEHNTHHNCVDHMAGSLL